MAYTYDDGVYVRRVEIMPGWHRFKSCNAQECKRVFDEDGIPRFIVWQLISYETPIIKVVKDLKWYEWNVVCNGNPFGYSPSTTRQVSRWISSHAFPFTPNDLRDAYDNCVSVTPDLSTYGVRSFLHFEFRSNHSFKRVWRQ